jgi:hypothetical protein
LRRKKTVPVLLAGTKAIGTGTDWFFGLVPVQASVVPDFVTGTGEIGTGTLKKKR